MEPVHILAIEDVLASAAAVGPKTEFVVEGVKLKKCETLKVIIQHGTTCVACGRSALFFTYHREHLQQKDSPKTLRLMFDHKNRDGSLTHMTKDHIVPKALGGPNKMENYQPMCYTCNQRKGAKVDINGLPEHLKKYVKTLTLPTPTEVSPYDIITYEGYIRWYTSTFHRNATLTVWNLTIKSHIRKSMKASIPDFDVRAFDAAYANLTKSVRLQLTKTKKGKTIAPMKPATFFKFQRENKSLTK